MKEEKEFYSTIEVSKILGISRIAVFKKIKSGEIRATKAGRNYVIPKEELSVFLGQTLSEKKRLEIQDAVHKVVNEYKETLRLLGRE